MTKESFALKLKHLGAECFNFKAKPSSVTCNYLKWGVQLHSIQQYMLLKKKRKQTENKQRTGNRTNSLHIPFLSFHSGRRTDEADWEILPLDLGGKVINLIVKFDLYTVTIEGAKMKCYPQNRINI